MSNEEWYRYDLEKLKYVLTEKTLLEAVKSYKEFYRLLESSIRQEPKTVRKTLNEK